VTEKAAWTHIIVGGGAAGCVLANRLSADPACRVLLLEAGPADWHPLIHIPLGAGDLLRRGQYDWGYRTAANPAADNRRIPWPRGKVLGGSSSLNGLAYARGAAADYAAWAMPGWSFADLLPYFIRAEHHDSRDGPLHGRTGPHHVRRGASANPLYDAFTDAAVGAGHKRQDDFATGALDGFGRWDFTIHRGRRHSTATAYLTPARGRANLRIVTGAEVKAIRFEGRRAVGVDYVHGGERHAALASAEVVLAAGAIGSPHLLLLSGIGDPAELARHGIAVRAALPGVGRNLQDHPSAALMFACPAPVTLHSLIRADRMALAMLRAVFWRDGPATECPFEGTGFSRSTPDATAPDLQWFLYIGLTQNRLRVPHVLPRRPGPFDREGFAIRISVQRPRSRGSLRLAGPDPSLPPVLHSNYLDDDADLAALRAGLRQARTVAAQPALRRYISGELLPGDGADDDAALDRHIRATVAGIHHLCGTCRMGDDGMAVVDGQLRVRGLDGLRVIDASIMPVITSGGTYAPTMAIAERGADLLLGRPSLPAQAP